MTRILLLASIEAGKYSLLDESRHLIYGPFHSNPDPEVVAAAIAYARRDCEVEVIYEAALVAVAPEPEDGQPLQETELPSGGTERPPVS